MKVTCRPTVFSADMWAGSHIPISYRVVIPRVRKRMMLRLPVTLSAMVANTPISSVFSRWVSRRTQQPLELDCSPFLTTSAQTDLKPVKVSLKQMKLRSKLLNAPVYTEENMPDGIISLSGQDGFVGLWLAENSISDILQLLYVAEHQRLARPWAWFMSPESYRVLQFRFNHAKLRARTHP